MSRKLFCRAFSSSKELLSMGNNSQSPTANPHSLKLYRDALLAVRNFPLPDYRQKIKYNIRELMEFYRHEKNQDNIERLVFNGQLDVDFLNTWKHFDKATLEKLFKKPKPEKREGVDS
ncbi:hypothetical protein DSO57_1001330 [Entomophthora muscae]|uniref:Uncharacterized protein n=1 Tax=Entomophthora muscae TaxID=34485 RepID=A0ACC2U816_9FUNG|nr:hypothetical protein DSO57_1001330 [Entomophthora muscae]